MMLAHTFPKFSEYKRLKGQYGQGLENCLLDFATFPGPIILTAHSLHNIENFYRGRLFTTDYITI
jgi:hydroxylamine reductase (hybrid-cluster protein)